MDHTKVDYIAPMRLSGGRSPLASQRGAPTMVSNCGSLPLAAAAIERLRVARSGDERKADLTPPARGACLAVGRGSGQARLI